MRLLGGGIGPGVYFFGDTPGTIFLGLGAFQSAYYFSFQNTASTPFPYIGQVQEIPFKCARARELVEAGVARFATDEDVWAGW